MLSKDEVKAIIDKYWSEMSWRFLLFAIAGGVRKEWLDNIDKYRDEIMSKGVDPSLAKAVIENGK